MRLLIIGNGPSADRPEVAAAMEQAEKVMRINAFPAGRHIGRRCDIWGSSLDHEWREPPAGFGGEVWWTAHPYCPNQSPGVYADIVAQQRVRCDRIANKDLLDAFALHMAPSSPSTGVILIAMALADTRWWNEPIGVAGFDGFAPGNLHYHDKRDAKEAMQWHNPDMEREWLRAWPATMLQLL